MPESVMDALIARYGDRAPRYTSYPPATQFHEQWDAGALASTLRARNRQEPWSLYVHIPFCESVCYYCACNKTVTKNHETAAPYVRRVVQELDLLAPLLGPSAALDQLHWGGGTPTFLSEADIRELMAGIRKNFVLPPDDHGEYSIEIDPRHAPTATLRVLREIGFNRLSMGIQDFDPHVQRAINREQSFTLVQGLFNTARKLGFLSLSADMIYGLPRQTSKSFAQTLRQLLELSPDRISLFHYAHLPARFKTQRRIAESDLPDRRTNISLFRDSIETLTNAGYQYIGLDHFAKADDELAVAQRNGVLARNFQGYSTRGHLDVLGVGASAVSRIGTIYSQNSSALEEYEKSIDQGLLPVRRGFQLNADDALRREVINSLLCHMECDIKAFEKRHGLKFSICFATEMANLAPFIQDKLVVITNKITVTARGQMLVRAICAVFDRYLAAEDRSRFSRVI